MGRAFGFISVILVAGIAAYLYMHQVESITPNGVVPQTMLDLTGVRNDLLAIANAERRYWALNTHYASLDELAKNGDIQVPTRDNFSYSAEASETSFRIIATYTGRDPDAPRQISIDESMALTTE